MSPSNSSTKLASLFAVVSAAFGLTTSGCYVQAGVQGTDGSDGAVIETPAPSITPPPSTSPSPSTDPPAEPPPANVIAQLGIDANATMSSKPGDGVGLYVEYTQGGRWYVFTTCDTFASGAGCEFDVVISPEAGAALHAVEGQDLDVDDTITLQDDGSIRLRTFTSFGLNGIAFESDPGALIEIDMLLDGEAKPAFVYSVDGGLVRAGVPTNPADFIPNNG